MVTGCSSWCWRLLHRRWLLKIFWSSWMLEDFLFGENVSCSYSLTFYSTFSFLKCVVLVALENVILSDISSAEYSDGPTAADSLGRILFSAASSSGSYRFFFHISPPRLWVVDGSYVHVCNCLYACMCPHHNLVPWTTWGNPKYWLGSFGLVWRVTSNRHQRCWMSILVLKTKGFGNLKNHDRQPLGTMCHCHYLLHLLINSSNA